MNINVESAIKFIYKHGNKFQKAYTACLFGKNNLPETLSLLEKYQNKDGGWFGLDPDYEGSKSSITCTMLALAKYERLNITDCAGIWRTTEYLKNVQKKNGSWDEPPGILLYKIPPWYYPRLLKNQIWFTIGTLRYLVSRKPEETEIIHASREYLRKYWENGKFPGYEHQNWMGIVSFSNSISKEDQMIYQGCLKNLEENLDTYDIADVAWTLESYVFLKLPKNLPGVSKAIEILRNGQREDGGFGTIYGQTQRVDVTIETLDSMAAYGEVPRSLDLEEILEREKQ